MTKKVQTTRIRRSRLSKKTQAKRSKTERSRTKKTQTKRGRAKKIATRAKRIPPPISSAPNPPKPKLMVVQTTKQTKRSAPKPPLMHLVEEVPRGKGLVGGVVQMTEDVVATIAGLAAHKIRGIYSLGKSRLISFGRKPTHGVKAEIGEQEVAFDLQVIIEYGHDIREIARDLRAQVAEDILIMTGRSVVEININVVGIQMPKTA